MFHKVTNPFGWPNQDYYDEIKEIPDVCSVHFPDGRTEDMSSKEMLALADREEWYVIVSECNMGVCDHWLSKAFGRWVRENYPQMSRFVNKKNETLGYRRIHQHVHLTKDSSFHKSEVWNS